jgi:hypothetical protein
MRLTAKARNVALNARYAFYWQAFVLLPLLCSSAAAQYRDRDYRLDPLGQNEPDQAARPRRGLYLSDVGSSTSYFTQANPIGRDFMGLNSAQLESDVSMQTSASISLNLPGRAAAFSIVYTPTYNRSTSYPEWNRLNHFISIHSQAGKPVKRFGRWAMDVAASVDANSFENFLFAPRQSSQAASGPATIEDLASGISQRSFNNSQLASVMGSTPFAEAPATLLFYGTRLLTAIGGVRLTYSYSPRLSISTGVQGARFQPLHTSAPSGIENFQPLQLRTSSAGVSMGLSYARSPRTQISWSVDSTRSFSSYIDAYSTTTGVSLSRLMGRHWFLEARGGAGVIRPVRQVGSVPQGIQYVAGGSLGYKFKSQTLVAAVDRSISDSFAIGAGSSITTMGVWRWDPVRSNWLFDVGIDQQIFSNPNAPSFNSWRAYATAGRMIGRQLQISGQYIKASYGGSFGQLQSYKLSLDGVRVSLYWTPMLNLLRR